MEVTEGDLTQLLDEFRYTTAALERIVREARSPNPNPELASEVETLSGDATRLARSAGSVSQALNELQLRTLRSPILWLALMVFVAIALGSAAGWATFHVNEASSQTATPFSESDMAGSPSLAGADLQGADLRGISLRGGDLRGACLKDANLSNADLAGADLTSADIRGATLLSVDLSTTTGQMIVDSYTHIDSAIPENAQLSSRLIEWQPGQLTRCD